MQQKDSTRRSGGSDDRIEGAATDPSRKVATTIDLAMKMTNLYIHEHDELIIMA
jgi:hypothetical protein